MSHDPDDSLGLTARDDSDLAICSLGACVHCLMRCLIDRDILSMRSFTVSGCGQWAWLMVWSFPALRATGCEEGGRGGGREKMSVWLPTNGKRHRQREREREKEREVMLVGVAGVG